MSSFIRVINMNDIPECLVWEVLVGVFSPKFVLYRMFKDTEAILSISQINYKTNRYACVYHRIVRRLKSQKTFE